MMERVDDSGEEEELVTTLRWMEQQVRERQVEDGTKERERERGKFLGLQISYFLKLFI